MIDYIEKAPKSSSATAATMGEDTAANVALVDTGNVKAASS